MSQRSYSWLSPKLEIKNTSKYGRGIFAKEHIKKGEHLIIMGGYIVDIEQENALGQFGSDYNMDFSKEFAFCPLKESDLTLMPQNLVNHSCEPNAGFADVISMVASKEIRSGEEVCYDYAFVMWSSEESTSRFQMKCQCGTPSCRKIITENDWKIKALQEKHGEYFQPFLRKLFGKEDN